MRTISLFFEYNDYSFKLDDIIGRSIVIHKYTDDLGLQGIITEDDTLLHYSKMSLKSLKTNLFLKEDTLVKIDKDFTKGQLC